MKPPTTISLALLTTALAAPFSSFPAENPPLLKPEEIIERTVQKESAFRDARSQYTYIQDVKIDTYGPGDSYTGSFVRRSEVIFDDSGRRIEKIIYFPVPTGSLIITPEDLAGFGTVTPFALTRETLQDYQITSVGKEKVDELDTYVFDIKPRFMILVEEKLAKRKKLTKGDVGIEGRAFQGRIWIDDHDYQIVKTRGKAVPEWKQRFPTFETYREQIDGKYWFPTYTSGDDVLDFPGNPIHIKFIIKYANYRRFTGKITILDDPKP